MTLKSTEVFLNTDFIGVLSLDKQNKLPAQRHAHGHADR